MKDTATWIKALMPTKHGHAKLERFTVTAQMNAIRANTCQQTHQSALLNCQPGTEANAALKALNVAVSYRQLRLFHQIITDNINKREWLLAAH